MTTSYFAVTTNGLSATVDALTPMVAAVNAYFQNPSRGITNPVPVLAGSWEAYRTTNQGPPGYVVIAPGTFQYLGGSPVPLGLHWAPGQDLELAADGSVTAPILDVRMQMFDVTVHGVAPGNWQDTTPGSPYALAQLIAATALSDLTRAALRDAHGHDLGMGPGKPLDPDRGEHAYGHTLTWTLGPIPIPVLGDVKAVISPAQIDNTVTLVLGGVPTAPGDGVIVS